MPPIRARAKGIIASQPGARCIESGNMDATRVKAVIRMGRRRVSAAAKAACTGVWPYSRRRLAKSTSRILLFTTTPNIISVPIKDWIFRVVPVR